MLYYRVTFSGNVRWKWGFGKAAVSLIGLISSWPSRHKTYRRRQPFRSADHGKLPRDIQLNEDSAGISREPGGALATLSLSCRSSDSSESSPPGALRQSLPLRRLA